MSETAAPVAARAAVGVLIVDDQAPFRAAARAVVRLTPGFGVVGEARSGETAVAAAVELAPELVLMDINLPGISGIEATRQITTSDRSITVILLSTYVEADLPLEARTCGAVAYLHKEDLAPGVIAELWHRRG